jgi:hypothetical protein
MKYLTQKKLKEYRDSTKLLQCPIFMCLLDDKVVDHDHDTGMVRGVIHRQANAFEGKCYNAWKRYAKNNTEISFVQTLRNMADYLEKGGTQYLHPTGLVQLGKRFARLRKHDQEFALKKFGVKKDEINSCNNSQDRVKLYKNVLKNL